MPASLDEVNPSHRSIYLPGFAGTHTRSFHEEFGRTSQSIDLARDSPPVVSLDQLRRGIPNTIFPPQDDRVRVTDTKVFPYSAICHLDIVAGTGLLYYGTGFLAGPKLIVTAGHNVFQPGEGFAVRIVAYPGLNGDRATSPFGNASSTTFRTVEAWHDHGDRQFDIGAILLSAPLGNSAGWFAVGNLADAVLQTLIATLAGYPKVLPGNVNSDASTLWRGTGQLAVEPNRLTYRIDATVGQSGAPVYGYLSNESVPFMALGVHNWAFDVQNAATRINAQVLEKIIEWRTESDQQGSA